MAAIWSLSAARAGRSSTRGAPGPAGPFTRRDPAGRASATRSSMAPPRRGAGWAVSRPGGEALAEPDQRGSEAGAQRRPRWASTRDQLTTRRLEARVAELLVGEQLQ